MKKTLAWLLTLFMVLTVSTVTVFAAETDATGSISPAYTSSADYWGEGSAKSSESFVVELHEGDVKIASATLNNIGGIIDGDVFVTWHIPFAGSNDEYWTVDWAAGYPKYDMNPDRVVLVSDGTVVATNNVQYNGPDSINQIVAAVADSNGKILSYATAADMQTAVAVDGAKTILMLRDVTLADGLALPAGVTLNGNGKTINGTISANGDLTIAGVTKVAGFSAGWYNHTITIGEGASLEITGGGRMTLGYGNIFNITGSIGDAKTADLNTVVPSLKVPAGISITGGNGAALNVKNAYIEAGLTSSKPGAANGTFDINLTNSVAVFTGKFALDTSTGGMTPVFNTSLKDSVLNVAGNLVFGNTGCNTTIDNSVVKANSSFRNDGSLNLINGSVLNVAAMIQFGENAGNSGTIVVDNSELNIACASEGHALDGNGNGVLSVINGGKADVDYVVRSDIDVDATSTLTTKELLDSCTVTLDLTDYVAGHQFIVGDISACAGTIELTGNDDVYATIDDGQLVLKSYVAKIGEQGYVTLDAALKDAVAGNTIQLVAGTFELGNVKFPATLDNVTIKGADNKATVIKNSRFMSADGSSVHYSGVTIDGIVFDSSDIVFTGARGGDVTYKDWTITNCEFKNINASGTSAVHFNLASDETIENFTFTNNTINGVSGSGQSGVRANYLSGNIVVTGNDISNVTHNAIQFINVTANSLVLENNKLASNAQEGIANLYNTTANEISIINNQFLVKEGQMGICYIANVDVSGNYWGGNAPAVSGTDVKVNFYYTDSDCTNVVYTCDAKIGDVYYETLEAALKAVTDGCTLEILRDITINSAWDNRNTGAKIAVPVTIDGNGHTLKFTGMISDGMNYLSVFRFEDVASVKDLTIDLSEATSGWAPRLRAISAKTDITIDNCTFIGNADYDNTNAVIIGEGAGAAMGDVVITITDSTFTNWRNGISDNQNGQDAKSATVTGNTFNNANVGIAAANSVVFNNNTMNNGSVTIVSYTTPASLAVTAKGNALATGDAIVNEIKNANTIDAQNDFVGAAATVNGTVYGSLEAAFAAAQNGDTIVLIADVNAAVTYAVNKTLTLDLNGYEIKSDADVVLTASAGELTIVDNSTAKTGAIVSDGKTAIHSSAYVAIKSGKFDGAITTANGQIDDSQVCITGGTFTQNPDADLVEHSYTVLTNEDGIYTVVDVEYTLTIINAGANASGAGIYIYGDVVTVYAGEMNGYFFGEWVSEDVDVTGFTSDTVTFVMPDHDVTLTVYWSTIGPANPGTPVVLPGTLNFETNGGTPIDSISRVAGTKVDLSQFVTVREGYTFTGWYSDAALTKPVTAITVRSTKTVYAGWIQNAVTPDIPVVVMPFTDVAADAYYYNAVLWAVNTGITTGMTDTMFGPDLVCTRAQVVTFLWRAAGCPVATNNDMPFADVSRDMYYYDAVLWAVEMGITNGISDTEFAPDAECSRAQIVTFLWRALGAPDAAADAGFVDVDADAYYATAVEWAVDNGITNGMGDNTFGADADCTRGQTVTFLFRFFCK